MFPFVLRFILASSKNLLIFRHRAPFVLIAQCFFFFLVAMNEDIDIGIDDAEIGNWNMGMVDTGECFRGIKWQVIARAMSTMPPVPSPTEPWVGTLERLSRYEQPGKNICLCKFACRMQNRSNKVRLLAVLFIDKDPTVPVTFGQNQDDLLKWLKENETGQVAGSASSYRNREARFYVNLVQYPHSQLCAFPHPDSLN